MDKSRIRVLIVDDYEPWCRFVSSTLHKKPELQIIAVLSDGLEAVQKAQELQPDLILLDIGLPTLNGIEVAKRIQKVASTVRILFASQDDDEEVVQAALSTGARGYLLKANGSELLPAIEAVLRGDRFVTKRLNGQQSD